jgi:hypothetical protein
MLSGAQRLLDHYVVSLQSGFGGLVVSMLASGTQDRGFKTKKQKKNPAKAVGFFRA